MRIGKLGYFPSARRALDKALFDKIRLIDLLERTGIFAQCRCNRRQTHRATFELVDNRYQYFVIDFIETVLVDIQSFESDTGNLYCNAPASFHLGKIADTAQKGIGNTRCPTAAHGNLHSRLSRTGNLQNRSRALHDMAQYRMVIILQMAINAETGT